MRLLRALALALLAGCTSTSAPPERFPRAPGHWPQWRGPNRDAVSTETGLLEAWPPGGPALLWKAAGHGEGIAPVTVAGGVLYLTGFREGREWLSALDGAGRALWRRDVGPHTGEMRIMRYVVPRPPCVDDDRLYLMTAAGVLLCLDSATGETRWKQDYPGQLVGKRSGWGWGDYPLVDGKRVICAPGGPKGTVAALDKNTGAEIWRSTELKDVTPDAALVPAEIDGVRQVVVAGLGRIAGVALEDGRLLWQAPRYAKVAAPCAPVVRGDVVLVAAGFNVGHQAWRVRRTEAGFEATEIYAGKELTVQQGGLIAVGPYVFGSSDAGMLNCLEIATGKIAWQEKLGKGSLALADGRLVFRHESERQGLVLLIDAVGDAYRSTGRLELKGIELFRTHPIVAGGRLYLRDQDDLYCFDVRGPGYRETAAPWDILTRVPGPKPETPAAPAGPVAPAYVSTPHDVVSRMLGLAGVSDGDVLMDLGSGDGRIVIEAARRHRCRVVGVELNPELVAESRSTLSRFGLADRAVILQQDLFATKLDEATVITLYLGEPANERLLPALRALKPGVRIVSHAHRLGTSGPPPDRTIRVTSKEDGSERELHLWTTPLKPQ